MHYALIAAGEGSRLKEEGVEVPKPLVRIQGLPMIERLIRIFMNNGARSISVICNEQMHEVQDFLLSVKDSDLLCAIDEEGKAYTCQLNVVVKTTPSSMHSLAELSKVIPEGKFCLTTVDTIFSEKEFSKYIRAFAAMDETQADGLFAVSPFVDDEKPLWVAVPPKKSFSCACVKEVSDYRKIIGFYDRKEQMPSDVYETVSGGIYCLDTRTAFPVLFDCLSRGQGRMRNYQRALIAAGLRLDAYVFPKIMDIDHVSDIEKAESWLQSTNRRMLAIARDSVFSPNNEEKDSAIFHAVLANLQQRGWSIEECSEGEWQKKDLIQALSGIEQVIHMSRSSKSLELLEQMKIPVTNNPESVRTVAKSRTKTFELLRQSGVLVPRFCHCTTLTLNSLLTGCSDLEFPVWIKIMRENGAKPTDVCLLRNLQDIQEFADQVNLDQIQDVVLTEHVDGELVKCYVVLGDKADTPRLLRWFRPLASGYSKFGDAEQYNRPLDSLCVDEDSLSSLAKTIGNATGLRVFGFDMIVQPDNSFEVIDVNDWPSFSTCRAEAADAIAAMIDDMNEKLTTNEIA